VFGFRAKGFRVRVRVRALSLGFRVRARVRVRVRALIRTRSRLLLSLARGGVTVIATIHQPSAAAFFTFDRLGRC